MGLLGPGGNIFEKGMVNEYYNKIPMLDPKDPADIVKYYSPDYAADLLNKIGGDVKA